MGNVACLLKEQGHTILGSDAGAYPPMSDVLSKAGISIHEGFDADRLAGLNVDLIVIGNAMSRGNPEVEWLLDHPTMPYVSLPELCREHLLKDRLPVVVTGTHGKTTTSTLTAYLRVCWRKRLVNWRRPATFPVAQSWVQAKLL